MARNDKLPGLPEQFPELRDDIKAAIAGKDDGDASTELSKNRTRMSELRTQLSEHRTDLSEHRSEMSKLRTEMSQHRTDLSDMRTHLSNERTHLSQIRTAVSLMSFGVTLNRFSVYLQQENRTPNPDSALGALRHIETVGAGMVVLGVVILLWSLFRYHQVSLAVAGGKVSQPKAGLTILTMLIILLGAGSAIWMIGG